MSQWKAAAGRLDTYLFLVPVLVLLGIGVLLALNADPTAALAVTLWFDPIFFHYNLALATIAILIVPTVTFVYVASMRGEKERRLLQELTDAERQTFGARIQAALADTAAAAGEAEQNGGIFKIKNC